MQGAVGCSVLLSVGILVLLALLPASTESLLSDLLGRDPQRRQEAWQALSHRDVRGKAAVEVLVNGMTAGDDDPEAMRCAALVLSRMGREGVSALASVLRNPKAGWYARRAVLDVLSDPETQDLEVASEALALVLEEPDRPDGPLRAEGFLDAAARAAVRCGDRRAREAAAAALCAMVDRSDRREPGEGPLADFRFMDASDPLLETLAALAEWTVPRLIQQLKNMPARPVAAGMKGPQSLTERALVKMGRAAEAPLAELLRDPEVPGRTRAASVLADIGGTGVLQLLSDALIEDPDLLVGLDEQGLLANVLSHFPDDWVCGRDDIVPFLRDVMYAGDNAVGLSSCGAPEDLAGALLRLTARSHSGTYPEIAQSKEGQRFLSVVHDQVRQRLERQQNLLLELAGQWIQTGDYMRAVELAGAARDLTSTAGDLFPDLRRRDAAVEIRWKSATEMWHGHGRDRVLCIQGLESRFHDAICQRIDKATFEGGASATFPLSILGGLPSGAWAGTEDLHQPAQRPLDPLGRPVGPLGSQGEGFREKARATLELYWRPHTRDFLGPGGSVSVVCAVTFGACFSGRDGDWCSWGGVYRKREIFQGETFFTSDSVLDRPVRLRERSQPVYWDSAMKSLEEWIGELPPLVFRLEGHR